MLDDEEFSRNATVDRYGRKLRKDDTKKQLEKFYRLEEDEEGEGEGEDEQVEEDGAISGEDDDEVEKELKKVETKGYDPARDGGFSSSSSDEDSSSESEDEEAEVEDADEDIQYPDQQGGSIPMGEVSTRIAVVNLDWDNIRAENLMAVFSRKSVVSGQSVDQG